MDSLESQLALGTGNASVASQLRWANVLERGFLHRAGNLSRLLLLYQDYFLVLSFCNLNSKLTQLRCLQIKQ